MASVSLRGIKKQYENNSVIKGIDLTIEDGEFVVFVGPSGCGKSTLLRIIAGLDKADSGSISIEGVDATRLPPQKRNVGFVFQHYALFRHMTIFENIAYGLRCRGESKADIARKVARVLDRVGLPGTAAVARRAAR